MDGDESSFGWMLYKTRFWVLFVAMFTSFSSGILWMSYSTIVNLAAIYYNVNISEIYFLPISVLLCSVLFSLIAMYILDKRDLKTGLRLGSFLILIGYFLRITPKIWSYADDKNHRYIFSLLGHCFVGFGLPFEIFVPSKIAEHWFPDSQRLCVTTIVSASYLSGLIFSDLIVERIISFGYDITDVTIFIGIPSIISFILTLALKKSKPFTPPSGTSAVICFRPFGLSLRQLLKQKVFCILMFYIGIVMGSFLSTILIVQELVKVSLNSIVFCGEFAAFYIGGGLFGALLSSLFTKKIKNIVFVMKVCVCGHSIASVLLFLSLKYQIETIDSYYWEIMILSISALTGFFVYNIIPFGLDLGSSCSFPNCTEAAANGLLIISGQSFGLLLTIIMRFLSFKTCVCPEFDSDLKQTKLRLLKRIDLYGERFLNFLSIADDPFKDCPRECRGYDYSISLMVQTIIIVLAGSFFIGFFQTEYRRMNNSRRWNVERILSIEEVTENSDTLYS